ncbi:FKBP-type peptidyl-prolyl cis-trans isomerase [Nitrospira japonica]|uniref:FKBP-type peptidyl-prolyl cis-trans isomerase n=1 Tax=Nitrospira japonica TaxID=1325564 RepID=UPI0015609135|nr:peptidylprolyl isomerase [Nitrospira japonica]
MTHSFHRIVRDCGSAVLFVSLLGSALSVSAAEAGQKRAVIKDGAQVSLEYTLRLDDQTVLESNVGKAPMVYHQGAHEIVPGLERSLAGHAKGDTARIVVQPAEGYGDVDPKAIQEVKKSLIPEAARKVGAQLEAKGPDGESLFPRVTAVTEDTVTLDFNHPLAGKVLLFDVTVLDVLSVPKK